MLSPAQFTEVKREMCERLVEQLPDAALGELIHTLSEMLSHYGTRDVDFKARAAAALIEHVTGTSPLADRPDTQPAPSAADKTLPSRPQMPAPPDTPAPSATQAEQATVEAAALTPTDTENPAPAGEAPAQPRPDHETGNKPDKANSMRRPADFAEQLRKLREEKAKAVAEARRLSGLDVRKASSAS